MARAVDGVPALAYAQRLAVLVDTKVPGLEKPAAYNADPALAHFLRLRVLEIVVEDEGDLQAEARHLAMDEEVADIRGTDGCFVAVLEGTFAADGLVCGVSAPVKFDDGRDGALMADLLANELAADEVAVPLPHTHLIPAPEVLVELPVEGRQHGGRRQDGRDGPVDQVHEDPGAGLQLPPERRPADEDEGPEERLADVELLHAVHGMRVDCNL